MNSEAGIKLLYSLCGLSFRRYCEISLSPRQTRARAGDGAASTTAISSGGSSARNDAAICILSGCRHRVDIQHVPQAHGDRLQIGIWQDQRGQQEIFPQRQKADNRQHDQDRARERQRNRPENAQRRSAIDFGGVVKVAKECSQRRFSSQNAEGIHRIGQPQSPVIIQQADVEHRHFDQRGIERNDVGDLRHHQRDQKAAQDDPPANRLQMCERVGRQRCDRQTGKPDRQSRR